MPRLRLPSIALVLLLLSAAPARAADFNDTNYHEVVLFQWDEGHLDVLIMPPVTPVAPWRIAALKQSVSAWDAGINALGPTWLAQGIEIVSYAPGYDATPPAGFQLQDVDIVVSLSAEPGVFGIGIPWEFLVCDSLEGFDWHQHVGSPWRVANGPCGNLTENVCVVINTSWDTVQNFVYDINAHEVGHCLGIGHVGDAGDFTAARFPGRDIMSYQETPSQVHCVSSLNILALTVSFADVLGGTPAPTVVPAFDGFLPYVSQSPSAYTQVACANPTPPPVDADWFWESCLIPIRLPVPRVPDPSCMWS